MSPLPSDLLDYVQSNRSSRKHRALIRELVREYRQWDPTLRDYSRQYVKRTLRIDRALNGSLMRKNNARGSSPRA